MTVYYITLLLILFFGFFATYSDYHEVSVNTLGHVKHTNLTRDLYFIIAIVLIFVSGFRYYVGTDYSAYYSLYSTYADEFFDSLLTLNEPGFRFICWFVMLFGGKGGTVIFVSSLITVSLFLRTIYKNTDCLLTATLLYVFLGCWDGAFNGVRQYLAAAILFSGIGYLRRRLFWKYLLVVFLAFLFHRSAIIMILIYFIVDNKINFKNILLLIIMGIVVLYSFNEIIELTGFILDEEISSNNAYVSSSVNTLRVLVAIVPAVCFAGIYWNREKDSSQTFWINMLFLNAIMMFATSNSAYLARISIYSAPFSALSIPELMKGVAKKDRGYITVIILILYALFWFYEIINSSSLSTFRFIFNYI